MTIDPFDLNQDSCEFLGVKAHYPIETCSIEEIKNLEDYHEDETIYYIQNKSESKPILSIHKSTSYLIGFLKGS